ncbi:hypothetical protein A2X44_03500 [candidate division CPR3 bacterium GWF2_35_18]|nr:MAG: hypothetical protein A2X44_03500 [candidate division CPR3 bacterium GWF2_35_18]
MKKHQLKAKKREIFGKKLKGMRRKGIMPGVVFGSKFNSIAIQFDLLEFRSIYKEVGETNILEVSIESDEAYPVLVKKVQLHPLSDLPLHADFYKVDLTQKVNVNIPLVFIGESEIIKSGEGVLLELMHEVVVECLPMQIPSSFEIDVSQLKTLGDSFTLKDLKLSEGVEVKLESTELICKIVEPMKEEVEAPVITPEEVEVIKEKKEGEEGESSDEKEVKKEAKKESK